jgi:hypothetical protein
MRSPWCLCVCEPPPPLPINFGMAERVFNKLGMYIKAHEPISAAYFINSSHKSVCISLLSLLGNGSVNCIHPFIASQRLGKHVPAAKIEELLDACVGRGCRCIPLSLLGNNSVKTFPRQRTVGGVVFSAVHVVSKESWRLVLPRTSCYILPLHVSIVYITVRWFINRTYNHSIANEKWSNFYNKYMS